jgi:sugar phosphate permease
MISSRAGSSPDDAPQMKSKFMPQSFRFWSTIMVVLCFLLGVVIYGGGRYAFGVFMKPLAESTGWSRTEISLAATINLIVYGISSPVLGWMLDRFGARKVMIIGSSMLAASLCLMYWATNLLLFYFLYGVVGACGANAAGRISQATIVANWFVKRRGMMLGVTAISVGLGTAIMAPIVRWFLDAYGWQNAFVAMGIIVIVFVLLPIVLFVKGQGKPEDRGFAPDGEPLPQPMAIASLPAANPQFSADDWTLGEVLRSKEFWAISIAMAFCYAGDYIVLLHGPADFEDRGHSGATAALILSAATLSSCVGRVAFGWLSDHASLKLGFVLMFGTQLLATPLLLMGNNIEILYAFAIVWGAGYGGASVLVPYALAAYYGRSSFGSVYGWATLCTVSFAALGGAVGGMIHDATKSYQLAWILCAALWLIAIVMILVWGDRPQKSMGSESIEKINGVRVD